MVDINLANLMAEPEGGLFPIGGASEEWSRSRLAEVESRAPGQQVFSNQQPWTAHCSLVLYCCEQPWRQGDRGWPDGRAVEVWRTADGGWRMGGPRMGGPRMGGWADRGWASSGVEVWRTSSGGMAFGGWADGGVCVRHAASPRVVPGAADRLGDRERAGESETRRRHQRAAGGVRTPAWARGGV